MTFNAIPNEIIGYIVQFYIADNALPTSFLPNSRCGEVFSSYVNTELNLISRWCENSSSDLCRLIHPYVLFNRDSHQQRMYIVENITKVIQALGFNTTIAVHPCQEVVSIAQAIDDSSLTAVWPRIVDQLHGLDPTLNLDRGMKAAQIRASMTQNAPLLKGLLNLNLSGLNLYSLPKEILSYCTGLQSLDLSQNHIQMVPPEIQSLVELLSLDLSQNQLTTLPDEFGNLAKLRELGLGQNQLSDLPYDFGNLGMLRRLDLSNNQLISLPDEFGNLIELRELDLSQNKLKALPVEFGNLTRLLSLSLSQNKLKALPDEIGNLTRLQELDLNQNKLTTLPTTFENLANLRSLAFHNNRLKLLPTGFENFVHLQRLDLSQNHFVALPSFENLVNLQTLVLNKVPLKTLPAGFSNLVNLRTLHLTDALSKLVSPRMKKLPHLRIVVTS